MWKKDPSKLNLAATVSARNDVRLAAERARKLLKKRALISAAASSRQKDGFSALRTIAPVTNAPTTKPIRYPNEGLST